MISLGMHSVHTSTKREMIRLKPELVTKYMLLMRTYLMLKHRLEGTTSKVVPVTYRLRFTISNN